MPHADTPPPPRTDYRRCGRSATLVVQSYACAGFYHAVTHALCSFVIGRCGHAIISAQLENAFKHWTPNIENIETLVPCRMWKKVEVPVITIA